MKIPLVDLKEQYSNIKEEIDTKINDIITKTEFILGKDVEEFEKEFSKYCGAQYSVAVKSGTSALKLALEAYGVGKDDEVITVPNTFIATAEAIEQVGAKVRFADIDPKTHLMNPHELEKKITSRTKAIMPVHLFGQCADMESISKIAKKHNIPIIEDACQAHGAEFMNSRAPITETAAFSFYPGKNLGAFGDAGIIVTKNQNIADKIRMLRDHGRANKSKYTHSIIGYNERLDNLQAGILRVKLKYLDSWVEKRRKNAEQYRKNLEKIKNNITLPYEDKKAKHSYHLFVIETEEKVRDDLLNHLKNKEIGAGIHYPIPLHMQPACVHLNYKEGDFPRAEAASRKIISLPMYPELKPEQIKEVSQAIINFFNK
jgi:dTDP-4-amino-4,6-dideoxygalactose transaminase